MSDWYLVASDGTEHKARFVKATLADAACMRWTKGLSWSKEIRDKLRTTFKLIDYTGTILGGISLTDEGDHVFIKLLESAPHTRYDAIPPRYYENVARLLVGFAGKISVDLGYDGFLALTPKTDKRDYFTHAFKAMPVMGLNMGIYGVVSKQIIRLYYK